MIHTEAPLAAQPDISPERFRNVLSQWPTGVSVISSSDENNAPIGLVIGSFCSISLDPPLVAFSLMKTSSSLLSIRSKGQFCVNILSSTQADLVKVFCKGDPKARFAAVDHHLSPAGMPVIEGAIAWIEAKLECEYEGGDHIILLGRVTALEEGTAGRPLIFAQGGLGGYEILS